MICVYIMMITSTFTVTGDVIAILIKSALNIACLRKVLLLIEIGRIKLANQIKSQVVMLRKLRITFSYFAPFETDPLILLTCSSVFINVAICNQKIFPDNNR